MPAPPARMRSASVPCGTRSTSSSPARYWRSNSLFSPTYDATIFRICFAFSRTPRPRSVVPQLFETSVRSFTRFRCSAAMRFSGFPHRPNPETMIVAPSGMSATAASAEATSLSIRGLLALHHERHGLPAADAERGEAALLAEILHRVEQRHEDPRPGGADRVTERDGAAPHVHVLPVEAQELVVRERHHRERLVDLPEVDVLRGQAELAEHELDRVRRGDRELDRRARGAAPARDPGERGAPLLLRP